MDPEEHLLPSQSANPKESDRSAHQVDSREIEQHDPFCLNTPSVALIGLTIAISTIGIPLLAVLTERPLGRENIVPTALELNGSKPPIPISLTRVGKSSSRNTSGQQK